MNFWSSPQRIWYIGMSALRHAAEKFVVHLQVPQGMVVTLLHMVHNICNSMLS